MPIPYKDLDFKILLHNAKAYDCIDEAGSKLTLEWNITDFEHGMLGTGDYFTINFKDLPKLKLNFEQLDKTMPFLTFGEPGQHYAYELFLSKPDYWGSRGAPFFWAYAAREFTTDKLPMSEEILVEKYMSIVAEFNIPFGKKDAIFIKQFSAGGMTSGVVGGMFAKDGLKTLKRRLKLYK